MITNVDMHISLNENLQMFVGNCNFLFPIFLTHDVTVFDCHFIWRYLPWASIIGWTVGHVPPTF